MNLRLHSIHVPIINIKVTTHSKEYIRNLEELCTKKGAFEGANFKRALTSTQGALRLTVPNDLGRR